MRVADREGRGAGLVGTAASLLVVFVLLAVALQAAVSLHTHSVVTGAARDAAVAVAGHRSAGDREAARAELTRRFHQQVGAGLDAALEWIDTADHDVVAVRVLARHPRILPSSGIEVLGLGRTDRRIEVRVERWR